MTKLTTAEEVVDALGGIAETAVIAGAKYSAASNWRVYGRFPARTYLVLQGELMRRGLNAPASLWGMALHDPPTSAKPKRRRRNGTPAIAPTETDNRSSDRD